MIVTTEQREHLRANQVLIGEHQLDPDIDVDEYILNAEEDEPYEGYYCICMDLDLIPLEPHPS